VDPYNAGIVKRKSAYVEYPQAVPLKYCIDGDSCIYIQKKKCGACKKICPTDAVNFDQTAQSETLQVGSLVLAPGFSPFDPSKFDNYQYANLPNVMTSLEFERILSASGPTMGHVTRQSKDKGEPKKIAWFQCVGSRDVNKCDNAHCSSVCCMYAIKEAVIAKEHVGDDLDCAVFYMDIRTPGKDFERFYDNAREKHGIRFIRSRVHSVDPVLGTDDLEIRYMTEDGELVTEIFDMIVLSIGMETSPEVIRLAKKLRINLSDGNFAQTSAFEPVATSRKGIYVCGAFQGPKDIPQSVVDSSAAASAGNFDRRPQYADEQERSGARGQCCQ
jgi:heterodisulfide reductase subunit A